LSARHRERARDLAQRGELRQALEEWRIALTIDPADVEARAGATALEGRIEELVAERVNLGRAALARGGHPEARRHLLAALALSPANQAAFDSLRDVLQAELTPAPDQIAKRPALPAERPATPDEAVDTDPMLADAREAFERGEYALALVDLSRLLSVNPRSPEATDLQKAVLTQFARTQLDQKDDEGAVRSLQQLVALAPDDEASRRLLAQARGRLVRKHYAEGIRLYREEKLPEAIDQWRSVLEYDPNHAGARKNIAEAERLLRALERRGPRQP
jgi:tetratricopeptide (TPR) repeat protein